MENTQVRQQPLDLVGLQRANHVPGQGAVEQFRTLREDLLDTVFSDVAEPGLGGFPDDGSRECLGDAHKRDPGDIAAGPPAGLGDLLPDPGQ